MASRRAKAALASGVGAVALASAYLIAPWEGLETVAYRDVVGVLTVCYGETQGVKPGDRYTKAECDAKLKARVGPDYYEPLKRCIPNLPKAPVSLQASTISAGYNVGVGAICKSTAARLIAASDWRGACQALTRFNRAGGRVLRGLQLRREYGDGQRMGELELCLEGL